jgi:hypothetical protein
MVDVRMFDDDQHRDSTRIADGPTQAGIEIVMERKGVCLAAITYRHKDIIKTISNVKPGQFILKLKTGHVIWSGEITKVDLFWEDAFPSKDLKLAAETEQPEPKFSRIICLLNDEVILRIIPGIGHSSIDIIFKGEKNE